MGVVTPPPEHEVSSLHAALCVWCFADADWRGQWAAWAAHGPMCSALSSSCRCSLTLWFWFWFWHDDSMCFLLCSLHTHTHAWFTLLTYWLPHICVFANELFSFVFAATLRCLPHSLWAGLFSKEDYPKRSSLSIKLLSWWPMSAFKLLQKIRNYIRFYCHLYERRHLIVINLLPEAWTA